MLADSETSFFTHHLSFINHRLQSHLENHHLYKMRSTILLLPLLSSLALAAPTTKAIAIRQDNAGSTSTSTTNNNGLVNSGLSSSSASASEDGQSTSSDSSTSCGKCNTHCLPFRAREQVGQ